MTLVERSLPEEVWVQVFDFLSTEDKHSVRCSCRYFRELLDKYSCLWRGFCVVLLSRFSSYNRQFWSTLGRRNLSGAVLRNGKRKNLKHLAATLPCLRSIALENWSEESLDHLGHFPNLRCLTVKYPSNCPLEVSRALVPLSRQITHLNICNVKLKCPVTEFILSVSKMTSLTSFLFHHDGTQRVPIKAFHALLIGLPKLRHLSWEMISYKTLPEDYFSPAVVPSDRLAAGLPLSSLELLNYDTVVSEEALVCLSGLTCLSVYHLYSVPGPRCHLRTWLTALPNLTTLNIHGGHPLGAYADCVPHTVTSMTLCVDMTADDLETLASRVSNLQHLHLEPWGSKGHIRRLPELFPQLRTLKMRHHNVPDSDFLGLSQLRSLERLEVLDPYYWPDRNLVDHITYQPSPRLLGLIGGLQVLTSHRVHVVTAKNTRDPMTCNCIE